MSIESNQLLLRSFLDHDPHTTITGDGPSAYPEWWPVPDVRMNIDRITFTARFLGSLSFSSSPGQINITMVTIDNLQCDLALSG